MTAPKKTGNKLPIWQDLIYIGISLVGSAALLKYAAKEMDPNKDEKRKARERKAELQARLGISMNTNTYEEMLAGDVINPDNINVSLEDVGGLSNIVEALYNKVILPIQRPDLFSSSPLLKPSKGVLLYGPPGTGKTMLAKAIAKESGANFMNIRASSLQSKWFGDTNKLVTALFTLAWKIQPCIIFIDEVDSMLGKRNAQDHDAVSSMKTEFMQLWDGFITDTRANIVVLAATNRPWDLDEAVLRRLPLAYEVGLPDVAQRESILRIVLSGETAKRGAECIESELLDNSPSEEFGGRRPLEHLAFLTQDFSGSDLLELCKQAACVPVHEYVDRVRQEDAAKPNSATPVAGPRALSFTDLETSIPLARPTIHSAHSYRVQSENRNFSSVPAAMPTVAGGLDFQKMMVLASYMAQMQAANASK